MYKKLLPAGIIVALALLIVSVYIFIPSTLAVSTYTLVKCNAYGAYRVISKDTFWHTLQEGRGEKHPYRLRGKYYNAVTLSQEGYEGGGTISRMIIIPLGSFDSIALEWSCSFQSSRNPFKRIRQYAAARAMKKDMIALLPILRSYLEAKTNIYGINVEDAMSKDSTLVATRLFSAAYPSTADIYGMVRTLRKYIADQDTKETNYPMLHVNDNQVPGEGRFETMVAIPVNKRLAGNAVVFPKLFVPYKILIAETKGGAYTGEHALKQLAQYVKEYMRTPMAMPFQSLVTERDKEPDTTKWITRVIQPVE